MMPLSRSARVAGALALAALVPLASLAQAPRQVPQAAAPAPPGASPMTAELFYQLLLGELSARGADPGSGFSLMMDAARRTQDPAVYRRAVEIALQSRAGDSALQAARAWGQAHPASREANRYVLQILLALNRVSETLAPLKAEIKMAPAPERNAALAAIPRLYARASDKKQAAALVEQALAEPLAQPATASAAWSAVGRMRPGAGDNAGALEAARRAQSAEPAGEGPAVLALELMSPRLPQAEALVLGYLRQPGALPELRMAYARALLDAQRQAEAAAQLKDITSQRPEFAEAWLVLGVLQVQDNQLDAAETALKRFVELAGTQRTGEERSRGLAQAYLGLAQVAEKRKDLPLANAWLDKIDDPQALASAQARRASILAQQGRLPQARLLLQSLPERNPTEARTKLMAEVQLLRDNKQYRAAYDLLAGALAKDAKDTELLYDQAMVAEKLGDLADMERLLRRAIEIRPDFHHAYNALGYSLADRNLRLPEARELILKALEFAPGDPFITDSLAWVEFRMGNRAEALRLLEQAYRQRPDAEIAAHLGEVLWTLGQRERAMAIWREGLMLNRDNDTLQETLKRLQVRL
jgi:tetratricopeptide (TPR) repeat protein